MKARFFKYLVVLAVLASLEARFVEDDKIMHEGIRHKRESGKSVGRMNDEEVTAEYWMNVGQEVLSERLDTKRNTNIAKNVILFLGDGMSITTITAARIYQGQSNNQSGEENTLSFDNFPHTGLSRTYCVNSQTADSACSATAYLCGVKTNDGTIGVTAAVPLGECGPSLDNATHVTSIGRWSQLKGKSTGVVTTTRVTHASPAGVYAHVADRDWEAHAENTECEDIAHQLIYGETGKNLDVIMGGGACNFLPANETFEGQNGERVDGVDLIQTWKEMHAGEKSVFISKKGELLDLDTENVDRVLGLFEGSHTKYNLDRDTDDPSLTEMTIAAIKILSKNPNGYFLFVEGGRIDHAHHDTRAHYALDETVEFSKAIQAAADMTSADDTLIVVTSDHAHTMTLSGYPKRGNPIFDIAGTADDDLPYASLTYANGRGYRPEVNGSRHNISNDDMTQKNYEFPSLAPLDSETHGGEDVAIFARGPWAHLFTGSMEQNAIPHIMAYASCVGDGSTICKDGIDSDNGVSAMQPVNTLALLIILVVTFGINYV